jgi:hypothetical protein
MRGQSNDNNQEVRLEQRHLQKNIYKGSQRTPITAEIDSAPHRQGPPEVEMT